MSMLGIQRMIVGTCFVVAASLVAFPCHAIGQDDAVATVQRLNGFRFGADRSVLDAVDRTVQRALLGQENRAAVAAALASVALSDAPFDARQAACRRLVLLASDAQIPAMVRLLAEPSMSHYSLMVLARIPGPRATAALRDALPRLHGDALLGTMDLLGERRDAQSVPRISRYLTADASGVAECAMNALARIGGTNAEQAMLRAFQSSRPARRVLFADAMLRRAEGLLRSGHSEEALRFYRLVDADGMPEPVRAAALRGIVLAMGPRGYSLLLRALVRGSGLRRQVAVMLARTQPGKDLTLAVSRACMQARPDMQTQLVGILEARRDPVALPAVIQLAGSRDRSVRLAAIRALSALGGAEAIPPLLVSATASDQREAAEALTALTRLRGVGVDAHLTALLDRGSPRARAVAVSALTLRNVSVPLGRILGLALRETGVVQTAALAALRELGRPSDLEPLATLMLHSGPDTREPIAATVVAIGRRAGAEDAVKRLSGHLERAQNTADRVILAEVIGQIGGAGALGVLTRLSTDADEDVRLAAVRALAEWGDAAPVSTLRAISTQSPPGRLRTIALRGYLRMLALPGSGVTQASAGDVFEEALRLSQSREEKKLVLAAMASVGSVRALGLAQAIRDDPELRSEAEMAALGIAHMTAGAWPEETRQVLHTLADQARDEAVRAGASALLRTMIGFGDYVMAWEVSPAYEQAGEDFSRLYDIPFPPESPASAESIGWRPLPVGRSPDQPWLLDILAVHGGEQRVAYLRTAVWSETDQDLVAEIGTDDGLKVWWNGVFVHGNNTQRAVAPAQEKVRITAHKGWNLLLIKVTQNVMGWGACVRLLRPDGTAAVGLRFMLPSALPGKL